MFQEEGENHVFPVATVRDQSKVRERPLRRTHLEERMGGEGRERERKEGEWEGGDRGGKKGEDLFDPGPSVRHYTCMSMYIHVHVGPKRIFIT